MNERTRTLTPRTDALLDRMTKAVDGEDEPRRLLELATTHSVLWINHARQLERELSAPSQAVTEGEPEPKLRITELLRDGGWHDLSTGEQDWRRREAAMAIESCFAANEDLLRRRSAPPSSQQQSDMEHETGGLTGPATQVPGAVETPPPTDSIGSCNTARAALEYETVEALLEALWEYIEYLNFFSESADDDNPSHEILKRRREQYAEARKVFPVVLQPRQTKARDA